MSPLVAVTIVAAAVAVTVTAMLAVRLVAPAGGFFRDPDRAAGVFAVTGTGFAVLLAFVIFLAASSYDRARDQASVEAVAVSQLFSTARIFSAGAQRQLQGELICYAAAVVDDEWKTMRHGRESSVVDTWLARIEGTVDGIRLQGENQRVAYEHWFDQAAERREGRRGRLAEASSLVPSLVWVALLLGGALLVAYMCFYADPAEPAFVQAMMMGAVTAMVVAGILVVRFLDRPYADGGGSIRPDAMATTLRHMRADGRASPIHPRTLCDERGRVHSRPL
jgi:hypothetical protein